MVIIIIIIIIIIIKKQTTLKKNLENNRRLRKKIYGWPMLILQETLGTNAEKLKTEKPCKIVSAIDCFWVLGWVWIFFNRVGKKKHTY